MAGEWLKMECSTPDKPEVFAITTRMGWDDPDLTVGKLFRVWRWFDQQTTDGNAVSVTSALLDRIAGVTGFAQAMQSVGWLTISDVGVSLPNFEKHTGTTAKARAQTAKRVATHRASEPSNEVSNAPTVTRALAREEKRREEQETEAIASVAAKPPRATRKCPESFAPQDPKAWIDVHCPGVDWRAETEKFRDYTFKNSITDWQGAWRNWIRRAFETTQQARASPLTFRERDSANAAARVHEMTGGLVSAKPTTRRNDALQEVFDATPRLTA